MQEAWLRLSRSDVSDVVNLRADLFAVPFDDIAPVVDGTSSSARQLGQPGAAAAALDVARGGGRVAYRPGGAAAGGRAAGIPGAGHGGM